MILQSGWSKEFKITPSIECLLLLVAQRGQPTAALQLCLFREYLLLISMALVAGCALMYFYYKIHDTKFIILTILSIAFSGIKYIDDIVLPLSSNRTS